MSNAELAVVNEQSREVSHMKPSRLDDSLFSKDLAPHYMKLASQLAASEMVPKCFRNKPADLFLCWSMGYQIGIPPEQAMNCIAVVNGKAVMWGDEMLALCMAHPDFEDIEEYPIRSQNDSVIGYICTIHRKGRKPKSSEFTLDMAKKAGLLAKGGVWNQYPERMLKLRARGFALRDAFPDALKGIKSREEVEDYVVDAEYSVVSSKPSRSEVLKQEIMVNKGIVNEATNGTTEDIQDQTVGEENIPSDELSAMDETEKETIELHLKIKELLSEKAFTDERLAKALQFYECESIDELSISPAKDFLNRLIKL